MLLPIGMSWTPTMLLSVISRYILRESSTVQKLSIEQMQIAGEVVVYREHLSVV